MLAIAGSPSFAGISVSPLKQELTVKPGQMGRTAITVSNNRRSESDVAQVVTLEAMDVAVSEEGALNFHRAGSFKTSASKWITLEKDTLTLQPGESQTIQATVKVPLEARGEFYSAIMATLESPSNASKGIVVTCRIASGIFLTVPGQSFPRQARITRCELLWPQDASAPTQPAEAVPARPTIAVVIQNTGKARFEASGKIRIRNKDSRTVFTAPLTSCRPCVFGGDSRLFEAPLDQALPAGKYTLRVELDYQSAWTKARYDLPLEITSEQAELSAPRHKEGSKGGGSPLEIMPDPVVCAAAPGAYRCLKVTIKNTSEQSLQCKASVLTETVGTEDWVAIQPAAFHCPAGASKILELLVRIPTEAPKGRHSLSLVVDGMTEDGRTSSAKVPIEVNLQAVKPDESPRASD
ncbi:MAG: DUF3324 domain-containing protein [Phycisphaerae bacterium]|nr:DUF3324 domain-containing protein [Phycisphaerae bacterium]